MWTPLNAYIAEVTTDRPDSEALSPAEVLHAVTAVVMHDLAQGPHDIDVWVASEERQLRQHAPELLSPSIRVPRAAVDEALRQGRHELYDSAWECAEALLRPYAPSA